VYDAVGIRTSELPITPDRVYRMVEARCKQEGVDSLDLSSPELLHSELQETLETRASEHAARDAVRASDPAPPDYNNGALFGFDPEIPADEQDERWIVSVTPDSEYIDSPRLAGSAWKHTERRHRGGS
jgi:hypothetical protein